MRVVAEQRQCVLRIAQLRRLQLTDRLQVVVEPQPAALHVEEQRRRQHGGVADGVVVVEPIGAAARNLDIVDFSGEVVALLATPVADETAVGPVRGRPFVIDTRQLQVVGVGPRLLGEEVIRQVRRGRLVGGREILQDVSGNRVDAIARDDVAGKRIARHHAVDEARGVGVEICTPIESSSEKSPRRIASAARSW